MVSIDRDDGGANTPTMCDSNSTARDQNVLTAIIPIYMDDAVGLAAPLDTVAI